MDLAYEDATLDDTNKTVTMGDAAAQTVFLRRPVTDDRDKMNYFFKVLKTEKSQIEFGLAEVECDYSESEDESSEPESSDADSDDEGGEFECKKMWSAQLWKGDFVIEEDGDEKDTQKIKTPQVIFDEKVYKPDRDEEVVVTMQLDKD